MDTRAIAAALTLSALTACGSTDVADGSAPPAVTALGGQPSTSNSGQVQNVQISGTAVYDMSGSTCSGPPVGYDDFVSYPGLVMSGRLQGCLYTKVDTHEETPSGVYLEVGREVFVGSLNGGPSGVFATTYRFESKFAMGTEVRGRCQHPLVEGSGTGGFAGATGRLDLKDIVADPSDIYYVYRGHLSTR